MAEDGSQRERERDVIGTIVVPRTPTVVPAKAEPAPARAGAPSDFNADDHHGE